MKTKYIIFNTINNKKVKICSIVADTECKACRKFLAAIPEGCNEDISTYDICKEEDFKGVW